MKPAALLLWLTLFGTEPSVPTAAFVGERPPVDVASAWVGSWLVGPRREPLTVRFSPVPGRDEMTGVLKFGSENAELWIGRLEGGRLRLNRSGVGAGQLIATPDGRLVGRLSRADATGEVELFRSRDEARARPASP